MTDLKSMPAEELLSRLVLAVLAVEKGREDALEYSKELRAEILSRIPPDGPPKTEPRVFSELEPGDTFIGDLTGWKYLTVELGEFLRAAVPLTGERVGKPVGFAPDVSIQKIIT